MRGRAFRYLVGTHDPEFGFVRFQQCDTVFHEFSEQPDTVRRVYEAIDTEIGKILDTCDPDVTLLVSDHSIGPMEGHEFRVNDYLRDEGLVSALLPSERSNWPPESVSRASGSAPYYGDWASKTWCSKPSLPISSERAPSKSTSSGRLHTCVREPRWASGSTSTGENQRGLFRSPGTNSPSDGSIRVTGAFDIDTTVSLGGGKRLVGYDATIIIADTSDDVGFAIEVCDGSEGTTQDLQEDADARDNELYVEDASAFSEGDHVYIERDEAFDAGRESDMQYSEKHLVDRIETGDDVLYLMEGVYFDYPTSDDAQVTRIEPDSGHFEGFSVTNEDDDPNGSYRFANAIRGHNVIYRNLTLKNVGRTGLSFDECYGGTVTGCDIHGIHMPGSGYGVRIRVGCANTLVANNHIRACRHNVAHNYGGNGDGMPRKTLIIGNVILGSHQGGSLDAHEGGPRLGNRREPHYCEQQRRRIQRCERHLHLQQCVPRHPRRLREGPGWLPQVTWEPTGERPRRSRQRHQPLR